MTALKQDQALLWIGVLVAATVGGSPAAACVLPFAAMAAVAGMTLDLRHAMIAVVATWLLNQAIGFGLMNYPTTVDSFGWGFALLGATVAAMLVARFVNARLGRAGAGGALPAIGLGFAMAFAVYETALFVLANFVGGLETFSGEIVGQIAVNDTVWFVMLLGLRWVLVNIAPARFGTSAIAR